MNHTAVRDVDYTGAMMTLQPAVWRPTARTRAVRGEPQVDTLYHAVRGQLTLCGRTFWTLVPAEPTETTTPRCARCSDVPDGHATAHDLVALGLTYRQVNHWCRQGWLTPDNPWCGSGQRMTFPPKQAEVAVAMGRLAKAGVVASAAHRAVCNEGHLGPGIRVVIEPVNTP